MESLRDNFKYSVQKYCDLSEDLGIIIITFISNYPRRGYHNCPLSTVNCPLERSDKHQFIAQRASPECSGRPFAGLFVFPPVFHVPGLNHGGLGIPGFPGDRLFFFFLHGIHPGFSMPRMGETMRIQAKSFCANSSFTAPSLPGAKGLSKSASSRNSRK